MDAGLTLGLGHPARPDAIASAAAAEVRIRAEPGHEQLGPARSRRPSAEVASCRIQRGCERIPSEDELAPSQLDMRLSLHRL
jgi:hypothetical protein